MLHVTASGDVGGLIQSYNLESCMHHEWLKKWKDSSFWNIIKRERKEETYGCWQTESLGGNEEGSNLPWKLVDFVIRDHNFVSMWPDAAAVNTPHFAAQFHCDGC